MSERDGRTSAVAATWYNPGLAVVFSARQEIRDELARLYCPHGVVRHVRSRDELRGLRCELVVMDAETAEDPENLSIARISARVGARPRVLVEHLPNRAALKRLDRSRQH